MAEIKSKVTVGTIIALAWLLVLGLPWTGLIGMAAYYAITHRELGDFVFLAITLLPPLWFLTLWNMTR